MARTSTKKKITVAVTGAGGYLAGRLIDTLDKDDRVERILGFDVRDPRARATKLVFDNIDVRNPALGARFDGVDVVVHLAFIMDPIRDEALMRDVNVNGSQNVFKCAAEAGVGKVIYTSSATAYGAHPDNDMPLTEDSPLRANLDFNYPAHKLEVEYVAKEFREEHPDVKFVIFRPAIVFGPNVDNAWSHLLELPTLVGIRGFSPPLQFVHEDDVAGALAFAVFADIDGTYNLAAEGWLDEPEALEIIGRKRRDLSEPGAFSLMSRLWSLGLAEAPPGMLHYLMHPWVMSVDKLKAAGFTCSRSNAEALRQTVEGAAPYVRFGHKRIKKSELAATAAGLGAVGAFVAIRAARGRV